MSLSAIVIAGLAQLLAVATDSTSAASACIKCHDQEAQADQASVHAQNGVTCTDCHGGDASQFDKERAKDPAKGYRGNIERATVPELCGACHADVRRMNPYGLPTDQLAQYRVSHHGEALAAGKTDVATCVDCHGAHGTRSVRDPQSPVYPKNVPATCGRCHSDAEKMQAHDLKANQEALYRLSVHAQMLLEKGDLSAPTCVTCHGSHGAIPPGFARVGLVCGKCHVKQKEFFEQGPHEAPALEGSFETCVTCHGNHKVLPASEAIYATCNKCHEEGDKARTTLIAVRDVMRRARQRWGDARRAVAEASVLGFAVDDEQVALEEAKTYLTQLGPMQHAFDTAKLNEVAGQVNGVLAAVETTVAEKRQAERSRKRALVPIAVFLVAMSAIFAAKRRCLPRQSHS